jgi:hypothetical protein
MYRDGNMHDTTNTIFKMVPDGKACNHTGDCAANVNNSNTLGVEYESVQRSNVHDISEEAYVKGALLYANASAKHGIQDHMCVMHGVVAVNPVGRRSDPYKGNFSIAHHFELVQAIRREPLIWQLWGLPQPVALV